VPPDVADVLFSKAQALNTSGIPAFTLFAGLVKALAEKPDVLALQFRLGLASENTNVVEDAVRGLQTWLRLATGREAQVPEPPGDLVKEIGFAIAARRSSALFEALRIARWIFAEGTSHWKTTIADSCVQGLGYLLEELRYDRTQEDEKRDVPVERWACSHLALAMKENGFGEHVSVVQWVAALHEDPLPEVRYAEMPHRRRETNMPIREVD
jgi:hypothetical protein